MRSHWVTSGLVVLGQVGSLLATQLFVSSYAGTITTLDLALPHTAKTSGTLESTSVSLGCAPNASWLTLEYSKSLLFCADEGLTVPNGTLSSYKTNRGGKLTKLDKIEVLSGPVCSVVYGSKGRGLAVAQYTGSSVSAFNIENPSKLELVQSHTFTLAHPGPNATRQDAPHPHEVVLDPTGKFILAPDLGADLVRVFAIDDASLKLTALDPLVAAPGSGPRHMDFHVSGEKTYMYLTSEMANTITGYEVIYNANSTLSFQEVYLSSTHGLGEKTPERATAAEIHVTPDGKFLIVSSRGENSLTIPNFDPRNSTKILSDPLIMFSIDATTGNLTHVQTFPSGGSFPRQFSINKAGDLIGVGLQYDSRVVVIERDLKTGKMTRFAANATVAGQITSVVFDEEEEDRQYLA